MVASSSPCSPSPVSCIFKSFWFALRLALDLPAPEEALQRPVLCLFQHVLPQPLDVPSCWNLLGPLHCRSCLGGTSKWPPGTGYCVQYCVCTGVERICGLCCCTAVW